ncbi:hypothetical protein AK812_SmicGene45557, partial [Symbiodinium microadriaticum]
ASIGSEVARYCSFRMLPKPAISFRTLHSKGLFGQVELGTEEFNTRFRDAGTGILRRECQDCVDSHKKIYMRYAAQARDQLPDAALQRPLWSGRAGHGGLDCLL